MKNFRNYSNKISLNSKKINSNYVSQFITIQLNNFGINLLGEKIKLKYFFGIFNMNLL